MRNDLITKLEKWEKEAKDFNKNYGMLSERKEKIIKEILNDPVRITEVTEETRLLREKALRNKEVKSIMERYRIRIEDIALVRPGTESIHTPGGPMYQDGWSPVWMRSENLKNPRWNQWELIKNYRYGGPKDSLQVLFEHSKNNQWRVSGIIFDFPREKRAA